MPHDVDKDVGIAFDRKVEPPIFIDPCLPDPSRFIVLLGMQRRVMEVLDQEVRFSQEGTPDAERGVFDALLEAVGVEETHQRRGDRFLLRSEAIISFAEA